MQNLRSFSISAYSQAAPSSQALDRQQAKLTEIMNAVNPTTPPRRVKRNFLDPDQNAQFHDPEDYDTSSQESIRRAKLRCRELMEGGPAKLTEAKLTESSPCSHVSCTPGMEDSPAQEGSMLLVGAGTGSSFQQYERYCRLFKDATMMTEDVKRRLAPQIASCMLDVNAAEQAYEAEERRLRTTSKLEISDQEQRFRQWARLSRTQADETRRQFNARLDAMQAAFNALIEEQTTRFRRLKAEMEEYERRWALKLEGMEALYRDVAGRDALEAKLMTKHLNMLPHKVSLVYSRFAPVTAWIWQWCRAPFLTTLISLSVFRTALIPESEFCSSTEYPSERSRHMPLRTNSDPMEPSRTRSSSSSTHWSVSLWAQAVTTCPTCTPLCSRWTGMRRLWLCASSTCRTMLWMSCLFRKMPW